MRIANLLAQRDHSVIWWQFLTTQERIMISKIAAETQDSPEATNTILLLRERFEYLMRK